MSADEVRAHAYGVIMAGGGGERFWPKSRQRHPKQLLAIFAGKTMIQMTADRISPLVGPERLLVITTRIQAPLVREQLPEVPETSIVAEPMGRDTAACIALAAAIVMERDPDGIMIVLPADHIITDSRKLNETLEDACRMAMETGWLVTLGIPPTGPSTGYGYIKKGEAIQGEGRTVFARVVEFTEKPDLETARRYVASGDYFWNSGMFVWRVEAIVREIRRHMPDLYRAYREIRESISSPRRDEVIREAYSRLEKISIDYGIMEKAENVAVAKAEFDWDDAGSWLAMARHRPLDEKGNVVIGEVAALDTARSIIVSDEGIVGCVGVRDMVIVKTSDAVLVCSRERAQEVKKIVQRLKAIEKWRKYT